MSQVTVAELIDAIASGQQPTSPPSTGIGVSASPDPFVEPTFQLMDGTLPSEVIFIKSPAAVGKSIVAKHLSAVRNAPLIDLAEVAVGTGSLQGLVSDYQSEGKNLFHRGELPIVVDALDEGRLLSGENSLEAFLTSSVAFLCTVRTTTSKPKLIFLGREESTDFSRLAIEIEDKNISTCTLMLDFFGQEAASQLIDLYNKKELQRLLSSGEIGNEVYERRLKLSTGSPMINLKDAYFSAIEDALEVNSGKLWSDTRGRTFAGYAPVLASIGTLLASVDNPIAVTNRLTASSTREAWEVIDTVIHEILQREKSKLMDKLSEMTSIPTNAYDPEEQLTYLSQLIGGRKGITLTENVTLDNDNDYAIYLEKVSQFCAEHPFVRSGEMANDVLGSRILAHALCNGDDLEEDGYLDLFRDLSKGPFLWRSIRRELLSKDDPFFDGKFVGYVLNSHWNDPMEEIARNRMIGIRNTPDGLIDVQVGYGDSSAIEFSAMPPIALYEKIRNCKIIGADLELIVNGATIHGGEQSSLFLFQGTNIISCGDLHYRAKTTHISGSLWLDAQNVLLAVTNPEIQTRGNCKYGWGEIVRGSEPWKTLTRVTLSNPFQQTLISQLLSECQENIPPNGVVLMRDYSIPQNDPQLMWTKRFGEAFPALLKLLVSKGRAERDLVQTRRRENKYRIKISDMPWHDLQRLSTGDMNVSAESRALFEEISTFLDQ